MRSGWTKWRDVTPGAVFCAGATLWLLSGTLVGCSGSDLEDGTPSPTPSLSGLTYYRDIQPLIQQHCQSCHVEGGIAPFPLATYADASRYAGAMASAVQGGRMPPWMPDENCQSFQYARVLQDHEKAAFAAWDEQGAPEGDSADQTDLTPDYPALAWIDDALDAGSDYTPSGQYIDDYHCLVLDPELLQDVSLIGFEIQPDAQEIVHHVLLFAADRTEAQALEEGEAGPGWTCFGGSGASDSRMMGGWVPGSPPTIFPSGTGLPIKANEVLIMQMHYNLDYSDPRPDRTMVNLQYAQSTVTSAGIYGIFINNFEIPANTMNYSIATTTTLSSDLRVWAAAPHMHTRGTRIQVRSERDGQDSCLIDIPEWDFHWQQFYFFDAAQGISMLKGDEVTLSCTFDNPTDEAIHHGEATSDEMCLSYFYITL